MLLNLDFESYLQKCKKMSSRLADVFNIILLKMGNSDLDDYRKEICTELKRAMFSEKLI